METPLSQNDLSDSSSVSSNQSPPAPVLPRDQLTGLPFIVIEVGRPLPTICVGSHASLSFISPPFIPPLLSIATPSSRSSQTISLLPFSDSMTSPPPSRLVEGESGRLVALTLAFLSSPTPLAKPSKPR